MAAGRLRTVISPAAESGVAAPLTVARRNLRCVGGETTIPPGGTRSPGSI